MNEAQARKLVVETGLNLQNQGLVARTWGNISQRIDENTFAVSPSGIFYEDIRPKDVALVNISDLSWQGLVKPSSEKGLHRNIYRDHPGVMAIVHTHQPAASSVAAARCSLSDQIPCAPYALPTTKTLAKKAAGMIAGDKDWINGSMLLANHGALCTGESMEYALKEALELEEKADALVRKRALSAFGKMLPVYQQSLQNRENPQEPEAFFRDQKNIPPMVSRAFSRRQDCGCILWSRDPYTLAYSTTDQPLFPLLDDMAQLIGLSVQFISPLGDPARPLKKREALLITGEGALCLGAERSDAEAVRMVLEKSARSAIESEILGKGQKISLPERILMRQIYKRKYSRVNENFKGSVSE